MGAATEQTSQSKAKGQDKEESLITQIQQQSQSVSVLVQVRLIVIGKELMSLTQLERVDQVELSSNRLTLIIQCVLHGIKKVYLGVNGCLVTL